MKKYASMDEIKQAGHGNWPAVLMAAGVPAELLNTRKHQPCPECGGTDRYRFTDHGGKGTWICNQCHPEGGSPIDLLMAVFGYSFHEAKDVLAGVLGLAHGETERREAKPLPAPVHKQDDERAQWRAIWPVPEFALKSMNFAHRYRQAQDIVFKSVFRDGNDNILGAVVRFKKSGGGHIDLPYTFCRHVETGVQEWRWHGWETPRPLYGLNALAAYPDRPVLVVEGEKCKNAADKAELPFAVVTWHGGCNNWDKSDWSAIQNRRVVLWPDCDSQREKLSRKELKDGVNPESKPYLPKVQQGGWKAMQGVAAKLAAQGCEVFIVNIPAPGKWPHGYDIADALAEGYHAKVDPRAVLDWNGSADWLIEYRPSETAEAEVEQGSPTPTENGVPAASAEMAEGGEGTPANQGSGEVVEFDKNLHELLTKFALIEGKTKAFEIKSAVEWSKNGLVAKYGKEAVDKWFAAERKITYTQIEVNRAKKEQQQFLAETEPETLDMLQRYVYLDGSASIWDMDLHRMLDQKSVKMRLGEMYKLWENSPSRRIVRIDNVVFEPGAPERPDYINKFRGLPFQDSVQLACAKEQMPRSLFGVMKLYPEVRPILQLMAHLCNRDLQNIEYAINWLAYPLQFVGAKMYSSLVFHGDTHGAGKSLFFEQIIKPIYGEYAATLGQADLESQYTGNRAGKLFVLFEEIFNNKQKYDQSGAMKHMITGSTMRVEKKFVDSYEEANHINCVFLSNEVQPFKIEENDRRYFVVWPRAKVPPKLKESVLRCLGDGGVEKFFAFLMSVPLLTTYTRDFSDPAFPQGKPVRLRNPIRFSLDSEPPMTAAKQNVIALGRYGWQTFYHEWRNGQISGVPYGACIVDDLYQVYSVWCKRSGETPISRPKLVANISTRMHKSLRWWRWRESNQPEIKYQNTIFRPHDLIVAAGEIEMDVVGRQVGRFRQAKNEYVHGADY